MPTPSSQRAQQALKTNLAAGGLIKATENLKSGATLNPETETSQLSILWAALGPMNQSAPNQVAGWSWLEQYGHRFPQGEALVPIFGRVLRSHPVDLADWLWEHKEAWGIRLPYALTLEAVLRKNTDGLEWLVQRQGMGTLAMEPTLLDVVIERQHLDGVVMIQWLTDRGCQSQKPNTLAFLSKRYHEAFDMITDPNFKNQSKVAAFQCEDFPLIWDALVKSGLDPDLKASDGKSARDWAKDTPLGDKLRSLKRQKNALGCVEDLVASRSRLRP